MIAEKTVAYIPFDRILAENKSLVFSALDEAGYEAAEVKDAVSWIEESEPTPDFLLAIFGEPRGSTGWLCMHDNSFVEPIMRTASDAKLPILIVLVRGKLSDVDAYADSTDLFYDVSATAGPLVDRKIALLFEAETPEQLADAISKGLQQIEKTPPPEGETARKVGTRMESIAGSSVADVATEKDALGFDVYVEAIGAYLTHQDTKGPLALSIEGEWGSGKSSFMLQLKRWLVEKRNAKTVWFNAWRHDKEEALWAAFALQFVEEMSDQMKSKWSRLRAKWRLMRNRFDWRSGWFDLVRTGFNLLLWIVIAVAIWVAGRETFLVNGEIVGLPRAIWIVLGLGGSLAAVRGIFSTVRDTVDIVGNPLRFNLKRHIDDPNYAERIGFIEEFHRDFRKIVGVYSENEKVFVFIDDLDRCEVPRAADMMQALNLMIGADDRLIFIMGMDRQKIAAGLAVKYEKLLPYIKLNVQGNFEQFKTREGTRFGYDFIEKFIQLPFRVPAPEPKKIDRFLENLKQEKETAPSEQEKEKRPRLWSKLANQRSKEVLKKETGKQPDVLAGEMPSVAKDETQEAKQEEIEMLRKWDEFALETGDDSKAVQETVKTIVAGALRYNPRRIKQFINLFRLKAYIAYNTGLFNPPAKSEDTQAMTFEQLAKFATIELRWPLLLSDLEEDYDLLKRLSEYAEAWKYDQSKQKKVSEPKTNAEKRWRAETELLDLIALKPDPKKEQRESTYRDYSLTQLNVSKLLQVSAAVRPPDTITPSQTEAPSPTESAAIPKPPSSPPVLRSQPVDHLAEDDVKKMLWEKNFFDSHWHKEGKGIDHTYETIERQGKKLVIDQTTGLTWQQSGSEKPMTFKDAETYIQKLKHEKYGGYDDWRLPTLEEAMSLMEPEDKDGLYIDSRFDRTQRWIWTADRESASSAWYVHFYVGLCVINPVDTNICVRAVR